MRIALVRMGLSIGDHRHFHPYSGYPLLLAAGVGGKIGGIGARRRFRRSCRSGGRWAAILRWRPGDGRLRQLCVSPHGSTV